jgi:hypothetical protein
MVMGLGLSAKAIDFYVAQTATGNGSGSNSNSCMALASVNSSWPAGAGDTIHLVGTLTNTLTVQSSGTAGNPITIHFEPGCVMTSPCWSNNAINITGYSYVVVDGGSNGLITATDTGSGLGHQDASAGVAIKGAKFVTVENLAINNLYVRTNNADESGGYGGQRGDGVFVSPDNGNPCANITISNCIMHDVGVGGFFFYYSGVCSNYYFVNNTVYRCSMGAMCGDGNRGSVLLGFTCSNNHIYSFSNWDDVVGDDYHHNGLYAYAYSFGSLCSNVVFNANHVGPGFGQYSTAGLYLSGNCSGALICNNVLVANAGDAPNDAFIYLELQQGSGSPYLVGNCGIYNNTIMGGGGGIGIMLWGVSGTNYIKNNVASGVATFVSYIYNLTNTLVSDHNLGYGLNTSQAFSYSATFTSSFHSWAGWQAQGYDALSVNANPLLNSDGSLQVGSPAIGAGANLSSIFTADCAGNPRPAIGNWTIGAYQYGNTSANNIVVNSNSDSITNGLLLQYRFNDGSGTSAMDSSGNGYTGMLTSSANVGWTNGMAGMGAVNFNNAGNWGSFGSVSSALAYSGDWTITFWAYNYSFPGMNNFAFNSAASPSGLMFGPTFGFWDGASFLSGLPSVLNTNQWYFIALSKSSGTNYQLYLNGVTNSAGVLANVNISSLSIGTRGGNGYGMNGKMEDFRIYNRALLGSEISILNANGPDAAAINLPAVMPPNNLQAHPPGQ